MKTDYKIGDIVVNVYDQKVRISEIDEETVVFITEDESVDVLRFHEFCSCFRPVKNKDILKEPSKRQFKEMTR